MVILEGKIKRIVISCLHDMVQTSMIDDKNNLNVVSPYAVKRLTDYRRSFTCCTTSRCLPFSFFGQKERYCIWIEHFMRYFQLSQERKVENQEYFRKSRLVEWLNFFYKALFPFFLEDSPSQLAKGYLLYIPLKLCTPFQIKLAFTSISTSGIHAI